MLAQMAGVGELIDQMLAAEKTLGGVPSWQGAQRGELRLIIPLEIEAVSCGAHLEIDAYPNQDPLRFRIMIYSPKCIWRVDFTTGEPHVNPLDSPPDIPKRQFDRPHYHSWADNRRYCTQNGLPDRLSIARLVPDNLRSFDSTFRWFCGETRIAQPPTGLIELPPRTALL
jgi:hypothetical protein